MYTPLPFRESVENKEKNKQQQVAQTSNVVAADQIGPPEIPLEEIIFDKERDFLGEGAYGRVYKGKCRGKDVAIKVPLKQKLTEEELKGFRHEVQIMRRIFHPNVVLFLGACTAENNFMIITELMDTDVDKVIHSNKFQQLTLLDKMKIAKDAALGMNWLGLLSIVHRDLKPSNLLVDKHGVVKVTDFGFSALKPKDQELRDKLGPKGTALYMAPEVMNQEPFNEKADVYSFGLILWELLTGQDLFPEYDDWDPFYEAICIQGKRPPIPKDCLPSLAYLMQKCWSRRPDDRPSFKEIVFRLDEIIVDCHLPLEGRQYAEEARQFWKDHYLLPMQALRDPIPWREFVKVLANELKLPISDFAGLQQLLATRPPGSDDELSVNLERFGQIVQWFGPFFMASEAPTILSEINSLINSNWFHGDISKDVSEKRLFGRENGTYLVRLSVTHPEYPFTISKIGSDKAFQHKRVKHLPDSKGFSVPVRSGGSKQFKSMMELVKCDELGLRHPCPKTAIDFNPYADE